MRAFNAAASSWRRSCRRRPRRGCRTTASRSSPRPSRARAAGARESSNEVKLASDAYVQRVLRYSGDRIEVARGQFLATLFRILDDVLRRYPMRAEARDRFAGDLSRGVEEAQSLYQVIETFNQA